MNRKNESIASFFSNSVSSLDADLGEMLEIMKGILGKVEIGGREMVCVWEGEGGRLDMQEAEGPYTCDQQS